MIHMAQKNMDTGADSSRLAESGPKNTEQAIMEAAEELFLEMGYNQATTTLIAKRAGVTHAMLHYYFRTKEHVFMKVLEKILGELMQSFRPVMSRDEPFWETLEKGISTHFDFLAEHPRFVPFLYDTMIHNPELIDRMKENFLPVMERVFKFHVGRIEEEIAGGRICRIDPVQLMADIVTLNLSTFLLMPVVGKLTGVTPDALEGSAQQTFARPHAQTCLPEENPFLKARKAEIIALVRYRLYGKL